MSERRTASTPKPARFKNYLTVRAHFKDMPQHVRWHFPDLEAILNAKLALEIPLAYAFLRTELAWNRALYLGVVNIYGAESELVKRVLDKHHLTRETFQQLYKNIYGKLPNGQEYLSSAETVRDRVVHGKAVPPADLREAIGDVLDYAREMHQQVKEITGFSPFGDMRGFAAHVIGLDKRTSKWLLKGMGFAVSI